MAHQTAEKHQLQKRIRELQMDNWRIQLGRGSEVFLAGYSDASFAHNGLNPGAGWGLWVRDHATRILRARPCPKWVRNTTSQYAELCSVYIAIVTALDELDTELGNILVIKNDNQGVCQWFGAKGGRTYPKAIRAMRMVIDAFERAAASEVKLIVKWVPGHKEKQTTKGYLNDQVDGMAVAARTKGRVVEFRGVIDPKKDEGTKLWRHVKDRIARGEFPELDREIGEAKPEDAGVAHCVSLLKDTRTVADKLPSREAMRTRLEVFLAGDGRTLDEVMFSL